MHDEWLKLVGHAFRLWLVSCISIFTKWGPEKAHFPPPTDHLTDVVLLVTLYSKYDKSVVFFFLRDLWWFEVMASIYWENYGPRLNRIQLWSFYIFKLLKIIVGKGFIFTFPRLCQTAGLTFRFMSQCYRTRHACCVVVASRHGCVACPLRPPPKHSRAIKDN